MHIVERNGYLSLIEATAELADTSQMLQDMLKASKERRKHSWDHLEHYVADEASAPVIRILAQQK